MIQNPRLGLKVKLPKGKYDDTRSNPTWDGKYGRVTGKITEVYPDQVSVRWSNGNGNGYYLTDLDYIQVGHPLTKIFKDAQENS